MIPALAVDAESIAIAAVGAGALLLIGLATVALRVQSRQQLLARRIALVRPPPSAATEILRRERAHAAAVWLPPGRQISGLVARVRLWRNRRQALSVPLKVASALALAVAGFALARHMRTAPGSTAMFACVLALGGWFLPVVVMRFLAARRAKAVAAGLPEALDLLVICVEAGLSLEDALDRIVLELQRSRSALAEELALTSADLKILPEREQALANLANRIAVPSVRSVVLTLSQTMRYGTPLAQALRVMSAVMRTETLLALEQRANQLPSLMTVPMILFLLPVIFLIVGGPAVMQALDMLKH